MIKPLSDRILVERLPEKKRLIILTDKTEYGNAEPLRRCKVVAVGPGKRDEDGYLIPTEVKPGDIVFIPGVGAEFPDYEKGQQIFVREDDIGFYEGQRAN